MFCPNCGNDISDNEELCSNCGINIKEIVNHINGEKQEKKVSKLKLLILIILAILIVGFSVILFFHLKYKSDKTSGISSVDSISKIKDENGVVKFIDGSFTSKKVNSKEDAYDALLTLKDDLKFNDVKKEFNIISTDTSSNITYYRFQQMYNGVEVYGTNLIISVDSNGNVLGMNGHYIPNINVNTDSKKTKEDIEKIIKEDFNESATILSNEKYVYANNSSQKLVFIVNAMTEQEIREYVVDANNGEIISISDSLEHADAYDFTGYGYNNELQNVTIEKFYDIDKLKTRYRLYDPNRNIVIADGTGMGPVLATLTLPMISAFNPMEGDIEDNYFQYGANDEKYSAFAKGAITTLKNYEDIYDYYLNVLGRKSYDNNGAKIVVTVGIWNSTLNLNKEKWNNAAWNSLIDQFLIGYSGDIPFGVSKDVIGHEFTHAVIEKTAKFASSPKENDKAFETGALNEGIADIMGNLIEGENWTINEKIQTIRDMANPSIKGYPEAKGEDYYYPDYYIEKYGNLQSYLGSYSSLACTDKVSCFDKGGVHINSTVPSHAAYLMYTNGAFSSKEEMAKVWYNALFLMNSYSDFEDAALAVVKTAKNLGLSSKSVGIIYDAFIETNMLEARDVKIKGVVSDGKRKLSGVKVVLKSDDYNYEFKTGKTGSFSKTIKEGTYELIVTKDGYETYKRTVTIHGNTKMNIKLKKITKDEDDGKKCQTDYCNTITIYLVDEINEKGLKENYQTYTVAHGTVIGTDEFIDYLNEGLGSNILKTDGKTFVMDLNGFEMDFAWYYKGTDEKFDFNEPINSDIEIEMKLFNGSIDNDLLKDAYNLFN